MPALGQTWGNGSDPWWVYADLPSAGQSQPVLLQATYCAHPFLEAKAHPQDAKQSGLHTDIAFTLPSSYLRIRHCMPLSLKPCKVLVTWEPAVMPASHACSLQGAARIAAGNW